MTNRKPSHNPAGHEIQPTWKITKSTFGLRSRDVPEKPAMTPAEIHALKLRQRGVQ